MSKLPREPLVRVYCVGGGGGGDTKFENWYKFLKLGLNKGTGKLNVLVCNGVMLDMLEGGGRALRICRSDYSFV